MRTHYFFKFRDLIKTNCAIQLRITFIVSCCLIFVLLGTLVLRAQEYYAFPDSNAIWSEVFTRLQPFEVNTYQYGISGDTLINSIWYKKIYLLNDTTYPLNTGEFCGALREDSDRRIFVIECSCAYPGAGDEEVILYDFSKTVGDTVFVGNEGIGPLAIYLIIEYIDSILIKNNYRKTFHFFNYPDFWIEGIGSTRSLFSPIMFQPTGYQNWELICFNQDNEVMYLNPDFNSCFPLLTGIEKKESKSRRVNIYPHPVSGISVMDLSDIESPYDCLEIYSSMGQIIDRICIKGKDYISINNSDFKEGMFLYIISGENINPICGKIIIQKN